MTPHRSNSQSQQRATLVPPTSSGRLRCGLLTSISDTHYPFFVAVTIDDYDSHIYRFLSDATCTINKLRCRGCDQTIFIKNGQVNHTLLPDGTPCSGSSEEVRREAQWAVCRWAAFHANLRAKAAGKNFFSKEDWQDFLKSVGFGQVKELTEQKYQTLKTFVERLEAKPVRLSELIKRVEAGEKLVESTNKFPLWHKRPNLQETASSTKSLRYETPALVTTQLSPHGTSGTQHHLNTGSDDKVVTHFKNFHLNLN
jgi:hypothetical protein